MKTKFPYEGKIDFQKYWDQYMLREDAVKALPTEEELLELARKAIVKEHLTLLPIAPGAPAEVGDTVTMAVVSGIPKFNKPRVTASLGRGLYNRELEQLAIGKRVNDQFSLTIQDQQVSVTILEIRRKSAPEPTDEMVVAMGAKNGQNQPITTVDGYIAFIREEKVVSKLAEINYYIMTDILKDYPVAEYDESDIQKLGELEAEAFTKLFLEQENIDLRQQVPESWEKDMGVHSLEDFIKMRHEWYQMKIQQCLVYQNLLDLPDEGKTDPLDHYEVLTEMQMMAFERIKEKLGG